MAAKKQREDEFVWKKWKIVETNWAGDGTRYGNAPADNAFEANAPEPSDQRDNYHERPTNSSPGPDGSDDPYGRYGSRYPPASPYGPGNPYAQPQGSGAPW